MLRIKLFLILFVSFLVSSCATYQNESNSSLNSHQVGEQLTSLVRAGEITQRNFEDIVVDNRELSDAQQRFILNNRGLITRFLSQYVKASDLYVALESASTGDHDKDIRLISSAFILFPNEHNGLVVDLDHSLEFTNDIVQQGAILAAIDLSEVFPPTASSHQSERITPLINSLSISIFGYDEQTPSKLRYKQTNETAWHEAYDLVWDPVSFGLTGSIVHLQPDTFYDIQVTIKNEGIEEVKSYSTKTRPNKPPLNPSVFMLRDIYTGGSIDLSEHVQSGSEDAWVHIDGSGITITGDDDIDYALSVQGLSYIYLENITIDGARRYGIHSNRAHHIWVDGCDVSQFGRIPENIRNGVAYENELSTRPINYDSGIKLNQTGVVTIENCEVHSPSFSANNWSKGHPHGTSAMLVSANHPVESLQGQYIVRNNRFFGTETNRFNDVIESLSNVRRHGGFIRDSAIHDNYLAYANDDIIELDGGQHNVLMYNNEVTKGFCGISLAPNMHGPVYVFNNYIHSLGDDRNAMWAAIKMGGLYAAPQGVAKIFQNIVNTGGNGIAVGKVRGDSAFWVESQNNLFIMNWFKQDKYGYFAQDIENYYKNTFTNDIAFNTRTKQPELFGSSDYSQISDLSYNVQFVEGLIGEATTGVNIPVEYQIPNFGVDVIVSPELTQASDTDQDLTPYISLFDADYSSFANQNVTNSYEILEDNELLLSGNTWVAMSLDNDYSTSNLVLSYEIEIVGEMPEIVGFGIEYDNVLTTSNMLRLAGTQPLGIRVFKENAHVIRGSLNLDDFMHVKSFDKLVFILDNDQNRDTEVIFKNVNLAYESIAQESNIQIGNTQILGIINIKP